MYVPVMMAWTWEVTASVNTHAVTDGVILSQVSALALENARIPIRLALILAAPCASANDDANAKREQRRYDHHERHPHGCHFRHRHGARAVDHFPRTLRRAKSAAIWATPCGARGLPFVANFTAFYFTHFNHLPGAVGQIASSESARGAACRQWSGRFFSNKPQVIS